MHVRIYTIGRPAPPHYGEASTTTLQGGQHHYTTERPAPLHYGAASTTTLCCIVLMLMRNYLLY